MANPNKRAAARIRSMLKRHKQPPAKCTDECKAHKDSIRAYVKACHNEVACLEKAAAAIRQ